MDGNAMNANNIVWLMMEDDDDDEFDDDIDDDVAVEDGARCEILVEYWKRLGDPTFQEHFRMDRGTFELLLVAVGNHIESTLGEGKQLRRGRDGKSLDYALMMVLWILASPDTFRSVGVKFGVSKQTVHYHYRYIIQALREMAPNFVSWPRAFEKEVIAQSFEDMYGFPSVVGCIDGCLIRITAPLEQPQQYVDWHRNYSIQLQGVCDHHLLFRDVYIGEPGSVGDKRTLKRSPLGRNMLRKPGLMSDKHLLGDGGYTLTSQLLIPYADRGHLTIQMKVYNYYLSRARSCIERAFALLKGKWRRLKLFPSYCLEYAVDHITACVVLHNFILLQGNEAAGEDLDACGDVDENITNEELLNQAKADGIEKREFITAMLNDL